MLCFNSFYMKKMHNQLILVLGELKYKSFYGCDFLTDFSKGLKNI